MLLIILSLGAVYAFIPIIIIIVLILAARGAAGRDFFEMFGISALVGAAGGIAAGGSGKGLAGSGGKKTKLGGYKTDAAVQSGGSVALGAKQARNLMDGGGGSKGRFGAKYSSIKDIKNRAQADKVNILSQMQPDEIRTLLVNKGYGSTATFAAMSDVQLRDEAAKDLSLSFLSSYYARDIAPNRPGGSPGALGAPTAGPLRMSVSDAYQLYRKQIKKPKQPKETPKLKLKRNSYKYRTVDSEGNPLIDEKTGLPVEYKPFSTLLLDAPYKKTVKEWPLGTAAAGAAVVGGGAAAGGVAAASAGAPLAAPGSPSSSTAMTKASGSYQGASMLEQLSTDQIIELCRHYGLDVPVMEKEQMIAFASNRLSAQQIQEYLNQSGIGAAAAAASAKMTDDNFYKALGLDSKPKDLDATRKAYLAKMKQVHPDVNKDASANEESIKANAAYEHAKKNAKKIWGDDSKS